MKLPRAAAAVWTCVGIAAVVAIIPAHASPDTHRTVPRLTEINGQPVPRPDHPNPIVISLTAEGQARAELTGLVTDQNGHPAGQASYRLTGGPCVLFRDGHGGQVRAYQGQTAADGTIGYPGAVLRRAIDVLFTCPGWTSLTLTSYGLGAASDKVDGIDVAQRPVQDTGVTLDQPPTRSGPGCLQLSGGAAPGAAVDVYREQLTQGDAPLLVGHTTTAPDGRWTLTANVDASNIFWAESGRSVSVHSIGWVLAAAGGMACPKK